MNQKHNLQYLLSGKKTFYIPEWKFFSTFQQFDVTDSEF